MPPFAGFRLVIADHALGLPCVHAVATTPAQRLGVLFALLHTAGSAAGPAHETHWRVSERWLDQSRVEVFLQAMQQLGWSDSRNVRLDIRWGAGDPETNRKRAEEMVALAPAIIVAFGSSAVAALLQATRWCSRGSLTRLAPAMRKCSRIVRGGDFSGNRHLRPLSFRSPTCI